MTATLSSRTLGTVKVQEICYLTQDHLPFYPQRSQNSSISKAKHHIVSAIIPRLFVLSRKLKWFLKTEIESFTHTYREFQKLLGIMPHIKFTCMGVVGQVCFWYYKWVQHSHFLFSGSIWIYLMTQMVLKLSDWECDVFLDRSFILGYLGDKNRLPCSGHWFLSTMRFK